MIVSVPTTHVLTEPCLASWRTCGSCSYVCGEDAGPYKTLHRCCCCCCCCCCQTRALRLNDDAHKKEALVYYGLESALSLLVSWHRQSCC
jgi:hypothetical protein